METSRRHFFKGAGLIAGVTALGSLIGCGNSEAESSWEPVWTDEADIVIVGYGGSGVMASIAALHENNSVIVLEKSPERDGGNTGCSTGSIHRCMYVDVDEWFKCVKHGAFGTLINEDDIYDYLKQTQKLPDWFSEWGIEVSWKDTSGDGHRYPKNYKEGKIVGQAGTEGMYLFKALDEIATSKGVDVRLGTPVKHLVQNPSTKEICGVIAEDADGKQVIVKAHKAVLLCCGGYENNPALQSRLNFPGIRAYGWGTPYNTGDAYTFAAEVGADFWHHTGFDVGSSLCFKAPSELLGTAVSTDASNGITPYSYLIVDYNGKRFFKEDRTGAHDLGPKEELNFASKAADYAHLPFFMVFDQDVFDTKPLWSGTGRGGIINTYAGVANVRHPESPMLDWGSDNTKALANGWIFKADTIEELAAKITAERPCGDTTETIKGINPEALATEVAKFNGYAVEGADPDFGRAAEHMTPLSAEGPYYAIEMGFATINTWGGPVRNGVCQTMTPQYEPIPRLYNCGECGSFDGFVYGIGNVLEALTTGAIAAKHAIKLEPWDAEPAK